MSDSEIWGLVFDSAHWDHGGWSSGSRDEAVVCACGELITVRAEVPRG